MLRLNPTQIRLDKRDLDWHIPRHVERQAQRAAAHKPDLTKVTKRMTPKEQRKIGFPDSTPSPGVPLTSKYNDHRRAPDIEIYSDDPVPQFNRAYWEQVLANGSSPTALRPAPAATAAVIHPSDDFLDSTHSARASIELDPIDIYDSSDNDHFSSPDAPDDIPSTSESSEGIVSMQSGQRPSLGEPIQPSSFRQRQSWNPFRRKTPQESDGIRALLSHVNHSLSGSMAVDGPSDRQSDSSRSTIGGMGPDLDDGLYGNRRDRRTISEAASRDHIAQEHLELPIRPHLPPQASQHSRNTSGSFPRSSLYIVEAAASSSPERRPITPPDNPIAVGGQGLLSLPPRRPKTYRPRSQTYSYTESEDTLNTILPQTDGTLTGRLPSLLVSHPPRSLRMSPEASLHGRQILASPHGARNNHLISSPPELSEYWGRSPHGSYSPAPPEEPVEIRSYRSNSSMVSVHSPSPQSQINSSPGISNSNEPVLPRRNLSPYAIPFVPRNAHRNGTPHLFLPPPFSATSRNVSISSTYPSSSPASPHTPPPRQPSVGVSPSFAQHTPSVRGPSNGTSPPNVPASRRIPVYDDRLSPSTQPQTPAGLPRNGLPAMATQNPFNTAPNGGLHRIRAVAQWQAFATPTRRPSARGRNNRRLGRAEGDQENEGTPRMTAAERESRRGRRVDDWALGPGETEWGSLN